MHGEHQHGRFVGQDNAASNRVTQKSGGKLSSKLHIKKRRFLSEGQEDED